MKKILLTIICLAMAFNCSCTTNPKTDNKKINVVCTVFPQYDFVREIAKDKVNVSMLLSPGNEAHSYEPSPADIISIKNADLFIAIGGESEHWALHLLEGQELKNTNTLLLIDHVDTFSEEYTDGMDVSGHGHSHKHDENCNHHEKEYDEHVWTSPENAIKMCKAICNALVKADSENAEFYKRNLDNYTQKLMALENNFLNMTKNAKTDTIIVGDRFPMRYLTEQFSLKYHAAFPGCSSKSEPAVSTVIYLCDKAKKDNIPVVFKMDYSDGRIAKTVAESSNAKVLTLYSCHNLSKKDFTNGETYLSLMEKNYHSLKEALNSNDNN